MNPMMSKLMSQVSPGATDMIRADHTHVIAMAHHYKPGGDAGTRQAIVENVCLGLEVHAQLEEEIFYPALRAAGIDVDVVEKSYPEHERIKELVTKLKASTPQDAHYDDTFMELIRNVQHHVADEETILLPDAERRLADQLPELGARMTQRRLQLAAPRAGDIARSTMRAFPAATAMMAAGVLIGAGFLAKRAFQR